MRRNRFADGFVRAMIGFCRALTNSVPALRLNLVDLE